MKDIAAIIESSTQYGRNLMSGIAKYAALHDWRLHFEQRGLLDPEPSWLKKWQGDGIITHCPNPLVSQLKARKGIPHVDTFYEDLTGKRDGVFIASDHLAVGKMAAEFLLEKKYPNYAYIGFSDSTYSEFRQEGYETGLSKVGLQAQVFVSPDHNISQESRWARRQRDFIGTLPLPCAIYCATDELAMAVAVDCRLNGISVPEQVAILGTDNDPFFCTMTTPTLSSIDPDIPSMGWSVASWLDALMQGKDPDQQNILRTIPPKGVISRQSTSMIAVENPLVATALEAIRNMACQGASVADIAAICHVSRRSLERNFSNEIGQTVKALIIESQLVRIKQLLLETDYTLAHIAALVGMPYAERLSHMFKRETGLTPGEFRKQRSL